MPDVDQIIDLVQNELPDVRCSQLTVTHPADDDGIWFFSPPSRRNEVQIESSNGNCPFLIEHTATDERFAGATVPEVVAKVVELISEVPRKRLQVRYRLRSLFLVTLAVIASIKLVSWLGPTIIPLVGASWGVAACLVARRAGDPFYTASKSRLFGVSAAFGLVGFSAGRAVQAALAQHFILAIIFSLFTVAAVIGTSIGLWIYRQRVMREHG